MSNNKITKVTTLEGYYASGDWECFCFDTHNGPTEHHKARNLERSVRADTEDEFDCRTYPGELLDEGMLGKRGRWTITVEFEPFETESN